jgi:hypothetical protein
MGRNNVIASIMDVMELNMVLEKSSTEAAMSEMSVK